MLVIEPNIWWAFSVHFYGLAQVILQQLCEVGAIIIPI